MANSTNDNILLIFQKIIEQESETSTYEFPLLIKNTIIKLNMIN